MNRGIDRFFVRTMGSATLLALLAMVTIPLGHAQTTPDATVTPSAEVPLARPDVQILTLTLPTGTNAISSVYPKQVPEAQAQARITRLIKLTGWDATGRRFSNAAAAPNFMEDDKKEKLSAASFQTTANIIHPGDGTIDWEPFLRAFGDEKRVNVICFTGPDFIYRGPTHFDSDRISLSVTPGQGTVTCVANIRKSELTPAPFGLPRYATPEPSTPKRGTITSQNTQTRRIIGFGIVALLAAGVTLFVYSWASRYAAAGNTG